MSATRLPDGFLEELKARVRVSDVVKRKVKLRAQGKEFVGLSPFTNEKTPSFYVIDEKRMYHDFSSGKSGDVINFIMETERLSFMEAVERLAGEAGMTMPKLEQASPEQQDARERLYKWSEAAAAWFEAQLRGPKGAEARGYLERRGLNPAAWGRYRIGYAPDGWHNLIEELKRQGAKEVELVEVGLAVQAEGRKEPYDRFRDRVMFPIEDVRGRVVAFGGRAIAPDAKPKYLNSSDSPLFHKGLQLYNYRRARAAMGENGATGLIVTEGYMDVIALSEAGFGHAVAPLGTAMTEDQLRLIWQAGHEPKMCFDGDAAGLRAANKAMERALPFLEPGRSLFFVLMPDGMDPDDLIRAKGARAMGEVLDGAIPLVDLLWKREKEFEPLDTPERQAGLEARLAQAVGAINHAGVRSAYERELRSRARDLFFDMRRSQGARKSDAKAGGRIGEKQLGVLRSARLKGLGLLIRCIETPALLDRAIESLAAAEFPDVDVTRIRDGIFDVIDACGKVDRLNLTRHLGHLGNTRAVRLLEDYPASPPLDLSSPEGREWLSALEQFAAAVGLQEESRRVREGDVADHEDEAAFAASHEARRRLAAARHALRASTQEAAEHGGQ